MVTPQRTPKRIAADIAALDWFATFVEAADPILIGEHGYEIEVAAAIGALGRDGFRIAARITSTKTESFPPSSRKSCKRRFMEAAGIEPASADAPERASTSVVPDSDSPAGRFRDDTPDGLAIL